MKNDNYQRMGVTPWLGDTRTKDKGGKATFKTATAAANAAIEARDVARSEAKLARDLQKQACDVLKNACALHDDTQVCAEDACAELRRISARATMVCALIAVAELLGLTVIFTLFQ